MAAADEILEIILVVGALWLGIVILATIVLDKNLGRWPWKKP